MARGGCCCICLILVLLQQEHIMRSPHRVDLVRPIQTGTEQRQKEKRQYKKTRAARSLFWCRLVVTFDGRHDWEPANWMPTTRRGSNGSISILNAPFTAGARSNPVRINTASRHGLDFESKSVSLVVERESQGGSTSWSYPTELPGRGVTETSSVNKQ